MQEAQVRRDPAVADFLAALETAVMAAAPEESRPRAAARSVFDRCRRSVGGPPGAAPVAQPVCAVLPDALALDRPTPRDAVASTFAALSPRLNWQPRGSATEPAFRAGHANAMVLGPRGIEDRGDLWIGATLMAPQVDYPVHSHPPEEVYLSLTPGEWWNADMDWTDPGAERLIYNPPGIAHRMRSGATPFLALWLLPI